MFRLCRSVLIFIVIVLAAVLLAGYTAGLAQTTPPLGIRSKTPDARAFVNARIVVSPDVTFERATLIIKDRMVLTVGDNVEVPPGMAVVDLKNKTIYPGFIDPFTDYGVEKTEKPERRRHREPRYEAERVGGNAWNQAIHAEKYWSESFRPEKKDSRSLMELGFTTVLSARKDGIFRGRAMVTLLEEGLPNDLLIRPHAVHVLSFDKGTSPQDYPTSRMGAIALVRQTLSDADWYQQAWHAYQLNPQQTMPEFNTAIERLVGIREEGVIFDGGTNRLSLFQAHGIGQEFQVPLTIVGSGYEYARIDDVQTLSAVLIVPLDFPEAPAVKSLEDRLDVSLAQLRHWEMAPSNAAILEAHDIPFALTTHRLKHTTDFWKNLRLAVKRGLSKRTALAALTVIPADICGIDHLTGTLEQGKLANFFVCDGDPFETETDIFSVWVAGKEYELQPLPAAEFAGQYRLLLSGREWRLVITGKPADLKGQLTSGDWKNQFLFVGSERNKIDFTVAIDSGQAAGVTRFSGRIVDDTISGRCVLPDGSSSAWHAVRIGAPPAPEDSVGETPRDDSLVSRLTQPNKAFGFTSPPDVEDVLIKHATVWTLADDGVLESADILVRNGKFHRIGRDLETPVGVRVIDAAQKHVTPGIVDAHSHIAIDGDVNEGTFAVTPEVRIGDVLDPDDINIYRQLAGGVTACLALHGSANPIGGQCQVIKLRWGADAEGLKFKGAAPVIKWALGENVKQSNWGDQFRARYPQTRMGVLEIVRDELQAAREYETEWACYHSLASRDRERTIPPRRDLRLEAMVEVLDDRRWVHCHAYVQSEILWIMRLAEEFGFDIDVFVHCLEGYKVADEMAQHGAAATIFSDWWAYKFEVYDAIPYSAALLCGRSVLASVNSDNADLARRLNQEAAKSVMYGGLDELQALRLVTRHAAQQLGVDDRVGSIQIGKDADFVVWSDNPLSIYARAEQTWIEGKEYFDVDRDRDLRRFDEEERHRLIQKVLAGSHSPKQERPSGTTGHSDSRHDYDPEQSSGGGR